MSPSVIDFSDDFDPAPATAGGNGVSTLRTLLLAPPSVAAHEEKLKSVFSAHSRKTTDLQMLDRLAGGLITLPSATYDLILVLTGAEGEAAPFLGRDVFNKLVSSLKAGGKLQSEDGTLVAGHSSLAVREAVLAGLVGSKDGFTKVEEEAVVPLRFGLKKKVATNGNQAGNGAAVAPAPAVAPARPAGVGFVDFSDDLDIDLDDEDDDDLIDEDDLLGEDDLNRAIPQPPECQPQPGKRRRACKDCTCGLKERIEAKDAARRAKADKDLNTLKLKADDLTELDFTVQGKTGSCNSCSLGDAFRCADCPYIGLPAFKPGEEVKLLNNVAQL
ncbi:DUF689-domain-containing protein [Thozetella sp. PMI_491]|nr:DUF689-domain-containing protein [Thozetella sp. PMI_491]